MEVETTNEIWKQINDYPKYKISNYGNVLNTINKCNVKIYNNNNYSTVSLTDNNNKSYKKNIHHLVATYFLINPNNYKYVCHIDNNKNNNHFSNLLWCNITEVKKHRIDISEPMTNNELWFVIPKYKNYKINKKGDIYSILKHKQLKPYLNESGYYSYYLIDDEGKNGHIPTHRLIAFTFIDNPENKPHVNHKNGNKNDNSIENLEWCTNQENIIHSYQTKLRKTKEIIQYNSDMVELKRFSSSKEAERELSIDYRNIHRSCKGSCNAGNFIFRYNETENTNIEKKNIKLEKITDEWFIIPQYTQRYRINKNGQILSSIKNKNIKLLKPYNRIYFSHHLKNDNGEVKYELLHRLIALVFIPNPENKPAVNHINGNKFDNRIENLEWCTIGENNIHAYETGLK